MKKRIVLALLLVAMVCALFTVTSLAAEDTHDHSSGWTVFTEGTTLTAGGKYYLNENITLTATKQLTDVTLCLNGHTVTAAKDKRAFNTAGTVTICDCTSETTKGYIDATTKRWTEGEVVPSGGIAFDLKGGIITGGNYEYGGAIYNSGTLTIAGINLAGNNTSKNGGAIHSKADSVLNVLDNTAIVGNTATKTNGGGIDIYCATLNIIGSDEESAPVIAHNTAGAGGGGIYIDGTEKNKSELVISYALIDSNHCGATASGSGGGIYINLNCGVDIKNATISNNVAVKTGNTSVTHNGRGGGILCYSKLVMTDCVVKDNTCERQGGGIYESTGGAELLRVTVEGNTSAGSTGGAYLSSEVIATDCVIKNNTAATNSGGIQNYAAADTMVLNNCTITGNVSNGTGTTLSDPSGGGGIYVSEKSTVIVNGGAISGNSAKKAGGGVLVRGNFVMNANTEFSANNLTASQTWTVGGLAMYVAKTGNVTMNGGRIINHASTTASRKGVAIHSAGTFVMNDGEISGNTSTATNFGIVSVFEGTFTMKGGAIKNNGTAAKVDGTVYVYGDTAGITSTSGGHFIMEGGEISGNATRNGVFYITGANAKLTIFGGTFKENTFSATSYKQISVIKAQARFFGGTFLDADGAVLDVSPHVFMGYKQNTATGTVERDSSVALSEHAGHEGINMWVNLPTSGTLQTGNYVLSGDTTVTAQLDVAADACVTVCLSGNTLTSAITSGYLFNNAGTLIICDCQTTEHKGYVDVSERVWKAGTKTDADDVEYNLTGGVITGSQHCVLYTNDKHAAILQGINIAGNKPSQHAAVQACKSVAMQITDTCIVGNYNTKTGGSGGGISADTSTDLLINNSYVDYNTCGGRGGGILIYSKLIMDGGSISHNTVLGNGSTKYGGGGVYNTSGGCDVKNVTISYNAGGPGNGGGYMAGGAVEKSSKFTNCIISHNSINSINDSTGNGGGVYTTNKGGFTLTNCTITDNTAAASGGGVYITETPGNTTYTEATKPVVTLTGNTISNNTASASGGGVFCRTTTTTNFTPSSTFTENVITDNTAGNLGGGMYLEGLADAKMTAKNNTITGNASTNNGGAMYVASKTSLTIASGMISGNTGKDGVVLFFNSTASCSITGGTYRDAAGTARYNVGKYVASGYEQLKGGTVVKTADLPNAAVKVFDGEDLWFAGSDFSVAVKDHAGDGKLVQMLAKYENDSADINLGSATLELNGKELKVNSLVADGEIKDSSNGAGEIIVKSGNVVLNPNNKQMAIGTATKGLYFTDIAYNKVSKDNGDTASYAFNFYLRSSGAKEWLEKNASSVKLQAVVTWNGQEAVLDVPETLGNYGNVVEYLLKNPSAGLKLTLKGVDNYEGIQISARVTSNGVINTGATETINPANAN